MRLAIGRCALFCLGVVCILNASARAQCGGTVAGQVATPIGAWAMMHWDPDGAGPEADSLILAAGVGAPVQNRVLRRVGDSWEPIGDVFDAPILALGELEGKLVAAGDFTKIGGVDALRIARWTGSAWEPMGAGFNQSVKAVRVYQGELIAAGVFDKSGSTSMRQIAAWNGSDWRPIANGASTQICCLAEHAGELIAGGQFSSIDGIPARGIAAFNGTTWRALAGGIGVGNRTAYAMCEFGGKLIVGGQGVGSSGILAWDGAKWSSVGSDIGGNIRSMLVFHDQLFVGGQLFRNGGSLEEPNFVASWNGAKWSPIGTGDTSLGEDGANRFTACLSWLGDELIASGGFTSPFVGGFIATWTGEEWKPLTDVLVGSVYAWASFDQRFVAVGNFLRVGDIRTNHVMTWNGASWQGFGQGLRSVASAATTFGGELIVSGGTPRELPEDAGSISAWNGNAWRSVGHFDAGVATFLCEYDGQLIAAGSVRPSATIDALGVASWNGASWSGLGAGIPLATSESIRAVCTFGGRLIVSGVFDSAGATYVNNMAAWDGTSWSHAGGGAAGPVNSMAVWNGKLVIGGTFMWAGDTPVVNAACWDGVGTTWTPMNQSGEVKQLLVYRGDLLARVEGKTQMQKWNGAGWVDFPFDPASIVAVMGGEIAAWKTPSNETIGLHALPRFVSGEPTLPTQPRDPVAYCGTSAAISVIVDNVGANAPSYEWRRGETLLADGPTGTGSVLVGVGTAAFRIENVGPADAGSYHVVVTNSCGTVTSMVADVVPNCCPADLSGDGLVDDGDFIVFGASYDMLMCAALDEDCRADFNRDGFVDDADFQVFVGAYGAMVCE